MNLQISQHGGVSHWIHVCVGIAILPLFAFDVAVAVTFEVAFALAMVLI